MQRPTLGEGTGAPVNVRAYPSVKGRSLYSCVGFCARRYSSRLLLPQAGVPRRFRLSQHSPHVYKFTFSCTAFRRPGAQARTRAHLLPGSETRRRFTLELAQAAWTSVASVLSGHFEGTARPFNLRSECSSLKTWPKLTFLSLPWFLCKPPCCARGCERMRAVGGGGPWGTEGQAPERFPTSSSFKLKNLLKFL